MAVASTIASAAGMFGGGGGLGMIDLLGPLFRWVPMLGFGAAAIAVTVRRRGRT